MCDLEDELLAEQFKREFNEQFHILVRMHLSFVLDLNTEENVSDKNKLKKWNLVPFNKRSKSKGVMEGAPLTQEGICQVYQLIEYLKKEQNIKVEGIFRRTGSLIRQQELKSQLNQGIQLELENSAYSIHDCASVLKAFLSELHDPLLTEAHYPAYCQIAELCGVSDERSTQEDDKLLVALQLILLLLPSENKVLLKDILDLLHYTTTFEQSNRMSADNLAKLFTPHLLCPRKLTPEQLHVNSTNLAGIVAFMINHNRDLFKIPRKLSVDFRARYEKRKILQAKCLNESVSDAASTVFTFVDQARTAKENETNNTETALAQLYAHIQSLPESSKKRKLVKQFNKENGHGTPLQVIRSGVMQKNKSLGDSIKKHIFHKSLAKNMRKVTQLARSNGEDGPLTPTILNCMTPPRTRLFCTKNHENSNSELDEIDENETNNSECEETPQSKKVKSDPASTCNDGNESVAKIAPSIQQPQYLTSSTPAVCLALRTSGFRTPDGQERDSSMSPITKSTQRMPRAMQETMMTPRSRKPVLLMSGTNINALVKSEPALPPQMGKLPEEDDDDDSPETPSKVPITNTATSQLQISDKEALTATFREYLATRSIMTTTTSSSPVVDSTFSSRTDDFTTTNNDFNVSEDKMSDSMLHCMNGADDFQHKNDNAVDIDYDDSGGGKKLVLKPRQLDENGQPIVYETSF